jgi:hypothetical protein
MMLLVEKMMYYNNKLLGQLLNHPDDETIADFDI